MSGRPVMLHVALTLAEAQALVRAAEYSTRLVDVRRTVHPWIGQRRAARCAASKLDEAIAAARENHNAPLFPEDR